MQYLLALCLALGTAFASASAASTVSLSKLLDQMGQSLNRGSYQISYVFVHNGKLDSLRLSHLSEKKNSYNKLEHLNGPRRMVIAHNGQTFLIVRDALIRLNIDDKNPMDRWRQQLRRLVDSRNQYRIAISGIARIAGRPAYRIIFSPRDNNRNGARLWLAVDSGLPLGLDAFNAGGVLIDQLLAVSVISPARLSADDFALPESASLSDLVYDNARLPPELKRSRWHVGWLPKGYELAVHRIRPLAKGYREHWMYSDGLSSLSVFVENNQGGNRSPTSIRRGETLILDYAAPDRTVTVVGGIPRMTAEKIARSVALQKVHFSPKMRR